MQMVLWTLLCATVETLEPSRSRTQHEPRCGDAVQGGMSFAGTDVEPVFVLEERRSTSVRALPCSPFLSTVSQLGGTALRAGVLGLSPSQLSVLLSVKLRKGATRELPRPPRTFGLGHRVGAQLRGPPRCPGSATISFSLRGAVPAPDLGQPTPTRPPATDQGTSSALSPVERGPGFWKRILTDDACDRPAFA